MKTLLITIFLFCAGTAFGQCISTAEDPCLSIHQSTINKAAEVADKLRAANIAIEKFQAERSAALLERDAAKALNDAKDALLATKDLLLVNWEQVAKLYQNVVTVQNQIIENLEKRLNKPRSGLQKLLKVLKETALIAAGLLLGRAGI